MPETISLITPILGMTPYVLIEMDEDADGEPTLQVKAGGMPDDDPQNVAMLPLLMVTSMENSPLHEEFRKTIGESNEEGAAAIRRLAENIGMKL